MPFLEARRPAFLLSLFLCLLAAPAAMARGKNKAPVDPSTYRGQPPEAAAAALMERAADRAENDSWENIAIGRVHLLAGRTDEAEAVFSRYDREAGDLLRIGRAYLDADDWDAAERYFVRVLDLAPEDEDWLAEIGAYYNLHGDRETAESLFERSFEISSKSFWNLLKAAGSYEGIRPQ